MRIFLVGPQGSGKSTQAEILAKKLNYHLINTGELVREFAEEDSEESREIRKLMDEGELVSNKITASLVRRKVAQIESGNFIIDGYPRCMEQLTYFDPNFDVAIYLELSDDIAKTRLMARGREDDTPEAIAERLAVYHQETEPVFEYYQKEGKLIRVDASKPIEEIAREIEERLAEVNNG